MEKKTIGQIIKEEVYKQNLSITDFAKKICCERANVYKIFDRNDMDIEQLALISKVLGKNFFAIIAEDYELAAPVDDEEQQRQKAITQMYDAIPVVLRRIGVDGNIAAGRPIEIPEEDPLPDFMLWPFYITFSYGQTFQERLNDDQKGAFVFNSYSDAKGHKATVITNRVHGTQSCDLLLEYMTVDEWEEYLRFALDVITDAYFPSTWGTINKHQNA